LDRRRITLVAEMPRGGLKAPGSGKDLLLCVGGYAQTKYVRSYIDV
jgi:hypothetical protein